MPVNQGTVSLAHGGLHTYICMCLVERGGLLFGNFLWVFFASYMSWIARPLLLEQLVLVVFNLELPLPFGLIMSAIETLFSQMQTCI